MPDDRKVYLLDPQKISPETIAVTFAKTSRSPHSFQEIADELSDEKSAEFHEKWVVGYGHASVAEHAVLHIAIENVSRLAIETIESNRLASYTEKSTRYQKWQADSFFIPPELEEHDELKTIYVEACRHLFETYLAALEPVRSVVAQENPPKPGESESAWDRRLRSEYVDVCRFLLPAAALANVGMTINARALEHTISKMLSQPLDEVRSLGAQLKEVARAEAPTLIKYADALPYLEEARQDLTNDAIRLHLPIELEADWCRLIDFDLRGEEMVLAAALYRFGEASFAQCLHSIHRAPLQEKHRLARILLGRLGRHDIPLRELEHTSFTFEVLLDQGAYFELKRHRMMTLTPQPLTAHLGYAVPRRVTIAGLEENYRQAMETARQAYDRLAAWNPNVASYLVPNAYNRRALITLNLRSAYHLIGLRSAENAHFSIRRLAYRLADEIQSCSPLLGSYLRTPATENWRQISEDYFTQTI